MAYPLSAYYGRKTYVYLDKCCFCGKPYADTGEWHTLQGNGKPGDDVWLVACDGCFGRMESEMEGEDG